jgi:ABC-2 type transport system ATP-binding protein
MSVVIQTSQLSREYKTYRRQEGVWNAFKGFFNRQSEVKVALTPTTLSIESGQIVGLVGANGAGKTTLLKMLSGLISPSAGEVTVLGYRPFERKSDFLRQISILLGQKAQLWWDLPPAESFSLLAEIYALDRVQARKDWLNLAERLDCVSQLYVQLRRLSLGERMKMEVIGSLLHRPRVLFLDEPTIGLDVMAQKTIRGFLQEYVSEYQPTIILTSHYMDDISLLANRLLLISRGVLVYDGTVSDFRSHARRHLNLDIENEGTDFEEVIHKFFEKESGRDPARDS